MFIRCDRSLASSSKLRNVTLYLADGSAKNATVMSYVCKSILCSLEVFPNFICNMSGKESYCFTNEEFLSNGKYIYLGGQTAFETLLLNQYSGLLRYEH